MTIQMRRDLTTKAALAVLAFVALAIAWSGYGRGDMVRWFDAFLMCG